MRTVPRNITRKGEFLSMCDYCGSMYLRSALWRDKSGLLRCPQDTPGRDVVTLAELTANRAAALSSRLGEQNLADGARPDTDSAGRPSSSSSYTGPTRKFTADDVYSENGGPPTYANPGTLVNKPGF